MEDHRIKRALLLLASHDFHGKFFDQWRLADVFPEECRSPIGVLVHASSSKKEKRQHTDVPPWDELVVM